MIDLKELCALIELNLKVRPQLAGNQILLTIDLSNGRKQTVMLTMKNLKDGQIIEVTSRCGVISSAAMVRASLQRNMKSPLGGIAMDTTTDAKTLDCVHRIANPKGHAPNVPEILGAITSVGVQADIIEGKLGHEDQF